jgi:1-acyl-sn-glycerol-3-phosphate acyltransferase
MPSLRKAFQGRDLIRRLRLFIRLARLAAVIALGFALALWLRAMFLIKRNHPSDLRQQLCQWFFVRLTSALPFEIRLVGEQPRRPMLWLANHVSWVDISMLGMLSPMSFLAKAEVRQWPLLGWLAAEAGTVFIQRGAGESEQLNKQLALHLQDGRNVLLFPEGTTTDGSVLRRFHSRLLSCAIESGSPIQPVAIRYLRDGQSDTVTPFIGDDDLLSHLFRLLNEDTATVEIRLLAPIDSQGMDRNRLSRLCHNAISQELYGDDEALRAA